LALSKETDKTGLGFFRRGPGFESVPVQDFLAIGHEETTEEVVWVLVPKFLGKSKKKPMGWKIGQARSGMGVDENCRAVFAELQRRKAHPYIVFRIDERRKQIVVDTVGKKGDTYDDFLACLPEADCRYAVYDFNFVTHDNCSKSKIFFISW
jgi:hypothetical protein